MFIRFSFLTIVVLLVNFSNGEIKWEKENWALGCDFTGNNLKNTQTKASECGNKCVETAECTHYMWNKLNKGTCWMKQGCVSKSDAGDTGDKKMFCGIIEDRVKEACGKKPATSKSIQPSSTDYSFRSATWMLFNAYRARHCAPPLELDDELNKSAQERAESFARSDEFVEGGPKGISENYAVVTRKSDATEADGIKASSDMYNERSFYDFKEPAFSSKTTSFTAMVWKKSTKLGVGYAITADRRRVYVVMHLTPKGNVADQFQENVLPATC